MCQVCNGGKAIPFPLFFFLLTRTNRKGFLRDGGSLLFYAFFFVQKLDYLSFGFIPELLLMPEIWIWATSIFYRRIMTARSVHFQRQ
jgi:hypothetical protein